MCQSLAVYLFLICLCNILSIPSDLLSANVLMVIEKHQKIQQYSKTGNHHSLAPFFALFPVVRSFSLTIKIFSPINFFPLLN